MHIILQELNRYLNDVQDKLGNIEAKFTLKPFTPAVSLFQRTVTLPEELLPAKRTSPVNKTQQQGLKKRCASVDITNVQVNQQQNRGVKRLKTLNIVETQSQRSQKPQTVPHLKSANDHLKTMTELTQNYHKETAELKKQIGIEASKRAKAEKLFQDEREAYEKLINELKKQCQDKENQYAELVQAINGTELKCDGCGNVQALALVNE